MGDPDEKDQIGLFDGCMIKDTFPERSTTSSVFGSSLITKDRRHITTNNRKQNIIIR